MNLIKQVFAFEFAGPNGEGRVSESVNLAPPTDFAALGTVTITKMISGIISFLMIAASLIFFIMLVMGGIRWIMSQGDETKVKAARDQVQHSLIGLVVVFAAWAIMQLISSVFGVDIFTNALSLPSFFTL